MHISMDTHRCETLRQMFADNGQTMAQWARERGFSVPLVYAVLSGRNRASRGESFRIAVALGLRPAPKDQLFFQTPTPGRADLRLPREFEPSSSQTRGECM
jgi:gp16 family phage-associated protein